jgi:hypothetical protein
MKNLRSAVLVIAFTLISLSAHGYSLGADWSFTDNPNGAWTLGSYTGLNTGTFSAFAATDTETILIGGAELQVWRGPAAIDPNIIKNVGATVTTACCDQITFNADAVTFGPFGGATVARWTAQTTGWYSVDASFATVQVGNTAGNAYVFDGTSLVDLGQLNAAIGYSMQFFFTAGTNFDFVVWGNNTNNKTTEVSANITALPEPGTLSLLAIGLAGIAWVRRRKVA